MADAPSLDVKYSIFSEVISGMEVADKIVSRPRDIRDNPYEPIETRVRIMEQ